MSTYHIAKHAEEYITKYGERFRVLIEDSLNWLEENEPLWRLNNPNSPFLFNRDKFIQDLVERAVK